MNLKDVDIKLLVVFDAIMRERSVTRAAHFVGMSQPAVSSALNRLRHLVDDDLFVRSSGGVQPTPRARELAMPIHEVLTQLQSAFDPVAFDAATAERTFRIASSDHCAILVLPDLQEKTNRLAPGIRLHVRPKSDHRIVSELDSGETDFALGILGDLPARLRSVPLFTDEYVCVMRPGHPLARKPLTTEHFLNAEHLVMTHVGQAIQPFDGLLAKRRLERNVAMTINQSLLGPLILRRSDLMMTALRFLVERTPAFEGLHVSPVPIDIPPLQISLAWSGSLGKHPAHRWLQKQIVEVCEAIA